MINTDDPLALDLLQDWIRRSQHADLEKLAPEVLAWYALLRDDLPPWPVDRDERREARTPALPEFLLRVMEYALRLRDAARLAEDERFAMLRRKEAVEKLNRKLTASGDALRQASQASANQLDLQGEDSQRLRTAIAGWDRVRERRTWTHDDPGPDLLPCPFCGGGNIVRHPVRFSDGIWLECDDCGARIGPRGHKDIAGYWNRRLLVELPVCSNQCECLEEEQR